MVDTTTMHNKEFKTSSPGGGAAEPRRIDIECSRLVIEHPSTVYDGFKTFAVIDGASPYNLGDEILLERIITLVVDCDAVPIVDVEYLVEGTCEIVLARIKPKYLYMKCGSLSVETRDDRFPCQILLDGHEPRVKVLTMRFAEGEACWVNMTILPTDG